MKYCLAISKCEEGGSKARGVKGWEIRNKAVTVQAVNKDSRTDTRASKFPANCTEGGFKPFKERLCQRRSHNYPIDKQSKASQNELENDDSCIRYKRSEAQK